MVQFRLFGIPIVVQPFFWVIMGLFGFLVSSGAEATSGSLLLVSIGLFVMAAFLSVLVHELGHAVVGRWLGGGNPHIVLQGFGGLAGFPLGALTRWKHLLMVLAGPGFQLILGYGVQFALPLFASTFPPLLVVGCGHLAFISIFWALINLLPILPLDGGQIMADLLGPRRQLLAFRISFFVAIIMLPVAIYYTSVLGIYFLAMMAWDNWQHCRFGQKW